MKPTAPIVLAGFVLDIVLNLAACGTAPSDGVHRVPVTSTDQPAIVHVRACTATATCGDGSQQSAPLHACPVAGSISLDVEDDACSAACEGRDGWVDLCEIADCHDTDEECDPS